jgi:hypothetical protein
MIETIIGAAGNILIKIVDKLPFKRKDSLPKRTLKLVLRPRGAWWHMGSVNKRPAMQVVCEWHVTNITSLPIIVTTAFIKKPKTETTLPLVQHPYKNVLGSYRISPKDTTLLMLDFWVEPPTCEEGEIFKATIVVKDQFNNEHQVKGVEFNYR